VGCKLGYGLGVSVPKVGRRTEADCQDVLTRPVEQVEVEIVAKPRRIQNLERSRLDGILILSEVVFMEARELLFRLRSSHWRQGFLQL
jgi:hypothetical protein